MDTRDERFKDLPKDATIKDAFGDKGVPGVLVTELGQPEWEHVLVTSSLHCGISQGKWAQPLATVGPAGLG